MTRQRWWSTRRLSDIREQITRGMAVGALHSTAKYEVRTLEIIMMPPALRTPYEHGLRSGFHKANKQKGRYATVTTVSTSPTVRATVSRKTITDIADTIRNTRLEGHPMTETNRQSALYSAVSSYPVEEVRSTMEILSRAERFAAWLESETAQAAATTEAPAGRAERNAVEEITDLAERSRDVWGALAVDTILGRVHELDGVPFGEAIDAAIGAIPNLGFGRHLTEAVVEGLRALTQPEQPRAAAEATTTTTRGSATSQRIISLLEGAVSSYGRVAQPLLDRARSASGGSGLTKEVAIAGLLGSVEYRSYPSQIDQLVARIRAL